jgi:hypothetical protein
MPKRFIIGPRLSAVSSAGTALVIGFSVLGLAWLELPSSSGCLLDDSNAACTCQCEPAGNDKNEAPLSGEKRAMQKFNAADIPISPRGVPTLAEEEANRLTASSRAHALKAGDYAAAGKPWMAIKEAKKAIRLDPQNLDAYSVRDDAYAKLGIHKKKREVVIQGRVCDASTLRELTINERDRRKMVSNGDDKYGLTVGITDKPLPGI